MQEITASHMYIYQPEWLNICLILFVVGHLVGFPSHSLSSLAVNGAAKVATSMQEITASHMYIYQPEWLNICLILFVVGHLVGFPLTV